MALQLPLSSPTEVFNAPYQRRRTLAEIASIQNSDRIASDQNARQQQMMPLEMQYKQAQVSGQEFKNQQEEANYAQVLASQIGLGTLSAKTPQEQLQYFDTGLQSVLPMIPERIRPQFQAQMTRLRGNPQAMQALAMLADPQKQLQATDLLRSLTSGQSASELQQQDAMALNTQRYNQELNLNQQKGKQNLDLLKQELALRNQYRDPMDTYSNPTVQTYTKDGQPIQLGTVFNKRTGQFETSPIQAPEGFTPSLSGSGDPALTQLRIEQTKKVKAENTQREREREVAKQDGIFYVQNLANLITNPDFPNAVGFFQGGKVASTIGGALGSSRQVLRRNAQMVTADSVLENARKMPGQLSNKDVEFLTTSLPNSEDDVNVWANWLEARIIPWYQERWRAAYGEELPLEEILSKAGAGQAAVSGQEGSVSRATAQAQAPNVFQSSKGIQFEVN